MRLLILLEMCAHPEAWVWPNDHALNCLLLVAKLGGALWMLCASPPARLVLEGQTCQKMLAVVVSEVGGGDVVLC